MSKTIELHCPSTRTTIPTFVVTPYQSTPQIHQAIRLALSIPSATLYTSAGKPITKLDSLTDGQRVLVAASPEEHMLPDSPVEFVWYYGQEGEHVHPDEEVAGVAWEALGERERGMHVASLNKVRPEGRNTVRFTRAWAEVEAEIEWLEKHGQSGDGDVDVDVDECEDLIEQRWGTGIDTFLPAALKPAKSKVAGKIWDARVAAALVVLSSLLPGQAHLAAGFLEEAVQMRVAGMEDVDPVVGVVDVVAAINIVYERAGVIPARVTKIRSTKAAGKERRKAARGGRKNAAGKGGAAMESVK